MTRSAGRALGRWLRVRRCAVHPFPFLTLHRGEPHILLRTLHEMNSSSNVTANDSTLTPSYSVLPLVQVISIMQRWQHYAESVLGAQLYQLFPEVTDIVCITRREHPHKPTQDVFFSQLRPLVTCQLELVPVLIRCCFPVKRRCVHIHDEGCYGTCVCGEEGVQK